VPHEVLAPPRSIAAVAAALVLAGAVLAAELGGGNPPPTVLLVIDAVLGGVACVALPVVHRTPVRGGMALALLSAIAPTATPVAATAVLWVARRRPIPVAAGAAGLAVSAQLVRGTWRPSAGLPHGWWLVAVVLGYAAVLGWGAWMQARQALLESTAEQARRQERTSIAREMHDTLAHRLSLIATFAGALEYNASASPAQVAQATGTIRSTSHEALEDLRAIIGVLRDDDGRQPIQRPQPTFADLDELVADTRRAGTTVDLQIDLAVDDRAKLPDRIGHTVYRIVQEALTNARKHAPGQRVRIAIGGQPGRGVDVEVSNPLGARRRAAPLPGAGAGLVGMGERVELQGGQLEHGVEPTGRYRVRASLPWPG
jgi:signal transduction histidine kinase